MTTFVCTAGTSIAGGPLRKGESSEDYRQRIAQREREFRAEFPDQKTFLVRLSAETNGPTRAGAGSKDRIVFLTSETGDGRRCGEALVALAGREFGCAARAEEIAGLQVADGHRFRREGVPALFGVLDKLKRETGGDIQLNATGGFKGTVPYLVLYGMFEAVPIAYVYEFSETLMRLPPLPVEFDWERLAAVEEAIVAIDGKTSVDEAEWRRLVPAEALDLDVADSLFERVDGGVTLSAAGLLMLGRMKAAKASCQVLLSASARAALDGAGPETRRRFDLMLGRVRNPLHRAGPRHGEKLHVTDLLAWKVYATSGPRMLYWVDGARVVVGELFADHDQYERHLKDDAPRRAGYDAAAFGRYDPPEEPDPEALLADLARSRAEPEEQIEALRQELRACREEIRELRTARNAELSKLRAEGQEGARKAAEAARRKLRRELDRSYGAKLRERGAEIERLREMVTGLERQAAASPDG